ncbi:MAG: GMP synthase [Saprospiraceae bacterium]|nr:GMP synthase [Saprospiraceae bacterium]
MYVRQADLPIRIAVLDMNNNTPNKGLGYIVKFIESYGDIFEYQIFDVRFKSEIPEVENFDAFISSGGPGSPFDGDGIWDIKWHNWLQEVWDYNKVNIVKKHVFLICHSFQMACIHFKVGNVCERKNMSFGTYPAHKTHIGEHEPFFAALPEPFYIADFRHWQVIQPDKKQIKSLGLKIVAIEKERPHVELERAIMAIRFSDTIFATQFHPEADAPGMLSYFQEEERKQQVITEHGEKRLRDMIDHLGDPDKVELTGHTILPAFFEDVIQSLKPSEALLA